MEHYLIVRPYKDTLGGYMEQLQLEIEHTYIRLSPEEKENILDSSLAEKLAGCRVYHPNFEESLKRANMHLELMRHVATIYKKAMGNTMFADVYSNRLTMIVGLLKSIGLWVI